MADIVGQLGSTFGFGNWNLGIGSIGNLLIWAIFSFFIIALIGAGIYWWWMKRIFRHRVTVFGMMGNNPMVKWRDTAREVSVGRAGDKLFLLRRRKRYLPPPTIQAGVNEWYYWEREDHELINIGISNVDEQQRKLGVRFVDTDMRMQRLGIEKNLQYRLQGDSFWQKHGQMIVNFAFYVIVTIMIIVLFTQFFKIASEVEGVAQSVSGYMDKAAAVTGGKKIPTDTDDDGSGIIPAIVLLLISKSRLKKWA